MNKTELYDEHLAGGGRMVEFAGWCLPVTYGSIIEEHLAARNAAAMFDVSHMGEISIRGERSREFMASLIPTRLDKLAPGKCMYSVLCREDGGVIDDLFVYMVSESDYFCVVNASRTAIDYAWMRDRVPEGVVVADISDTLSKIDVQGPRALEVLVRILPDIGSPVMPRFSFVRVRWDAHEVIVSQSGYTGEYGFEIYSPSGAAPSLWRAILDAGRDSGLRPAGLGARDTLRLEAGYNLYGHELADDINPFEAGIGWTVSSQERYTGRDALDAVAKSGPGRSIAAFRSPGKKIARDGARVLRGSNVIGRVTSGGYSPTFGCAIGLVMLDRNSAGEGDRVSLAEGERMIDAVIARRPLYPYMGGRPAPSR